jgi:hypothetical protein
MPFADRGMRFVFLQGQRHQRSSAAGEAARRYNLSLITPLGQAIIDLVRDNALNAKRTSDSKHTELAPALQVLAAPSWSQRSLLLGTVDKKATAICEHPDRSAVNNSVCKPVEDCIDS